jgi:hypothetical protein
MEYLEKISKALQNLNCAKQGNSLFPVFRGVCIGGSVYSGMEAKVLVLEGDIDTDSLFDPVFFANKRNFCIISFRNAIYKLTDHS